MKSSNNITWKSFNEICEINPKPESNIPDNKEVSFIPMASVTNNGQICDMQFIKYSEGKKGYTIFKEGDILFAKITPCMENGKGAIARNLKNGIGVGSTEFHVLRPNDEVLSEWLYRFTSSTYFRSIAAKNMTGTAGQKRVPVSFFGKIKIPVLPLIAQHRIAEILDKADGARQKRQESLKLSDQFLKSTFLELFGDPIKNPKGWPIKNFSEIYGSIRYATGSPPEYREQGIPFIRATDIKEGTIVTKGIKYISPEDALEIKKCKLSYGNLVIVRSGVNAGDCAIIPKPLDGAYAAYDLIIELPLYSAVFYNHLINSTFGKTMLAPLKRRAGQPHLNAEQIGSLKFIYPPIDIQQRFAQIVEKTEGLKGKQHASAQELDNLFNSLMQRAFRGELVK